MKLPLKPETMKYPIFLFSLIFAFSIQAKTSLLDAVQQKKVKVDLEYNRFGAEAFQVKVTNLTVQKLDIFIPSGMIFEPEDKGEQTLMNVDEEFFALNGKQTIDKTVAGYCIMYKKLAPSREQNFKLGMTTHKNLLSFLDFTKNNKVTKDNYQAAIWAITDNNDIAEIESSTPADSLLREMIAKMTNRKNPWYHRPTELDITPGESIVKRSISIEGKIEVEVDHDFEVYVTVEKITGERKFKLKNMLMKKNSSNTFTFKVQAKGWEEGDYKVVVRKVSDNSEVKSFPFSV